MTAVTRLSLRDFRSYPDLLLGVGARAVVLTGENGAGKTNLLEALSLLAPGRGLRGATLGEMAASAGAGGFAVAARLIDPDAELGTGTLAAAPERRQVRVNGAAASAGALSERVAVLWLTPALDRLFVEGASERRRFLDRLTLAREAAHAGHATRYEAAMRARNRLLGEPDSADPDWLAALEAGLAEHGVALAAARARTVDALSERLGSQAPGPFARAGLALEGWRPAKEDPQRALALELRASRGRDAAAGRTLVGPHRSDLAVTHLDKREPAARCSTGEQKALLLGMVLAHADLVADQTGTRPLLLLDEVAAHLDPRRRRALFERLDATGGQAWLTGTERGLFDGLGPATSWVEVAPGAAERVS